uniref:Transposase domain-containing protein n=1 Tax=Panagrellus redivivus TaxID=6233 RepID=A0A7E4VNC3_PANRE
MLADISNADDIPWKGERNRETVMGIKERSRTPEGAERTFRGLNIDRMRALINYLDKLSYSDEVDYNFVYSLVRESAKRNQVDLSLPYDWITATEARREQQSQNGAGTSRTQTMATSQASTQH